MNEFTGSLLFSGASVFGLFCGTDRSRVRYGCFSIFLDLRLRSGFVNQVRWRHGCDRDLSFWCVGITVAVGDCHPDTLTSRVRTGFVKMIIYFLSFLSVFGEILFRSRCFYSCFFFFVLNDILIFYLYFECNFYFEFRLMLSILRKSWWDFVRCFSQYSLCTVFILVKVQSVYTVVIIRFHIFQLLLSCVLTDKTVTTVWTQGSSLCVIKTNHGSWTLWLVNQEWVVN